MATRWVAIHTEMRVSTYWFAETSRSRASTRQ
jgi:hypothetical protein